MKKLVILGAGQMGSSALRLLNRQFYEPIAFGDNAGPYPRSKGGVPVLPVEDALKLCPDAVLAAVISRERCEALEKQARSAGYEGEFIILTDLYEAIDVRSSSLILAAERIRDGVEGDIAELGVYRGDTAAVLNDMFPERTLYLFDTFQSFSDSDIETEKSVTGAKIFADEFADTSPELVLSKLSCPEKAVIRQGWFPDTAEGVETSFAFVSLDADLYAPTLAGLKWFMPRLSCGGMILLHDYNNPRFPGVKQAVRDFEAENGAVPLVPLGDLHGTAVIVKC